MKSAWDWLACSLVLGGCLLVVTVLPGCDLTLGPKIKTEYVIVHPGKPIEVLENVEATGRVLDNSAVAPVKQNLGGWIAMPQEHWDAVKRALEAKK